MHENALSLSLSLLSLGGLLQFNSAYERFAPQCLAIFISGVTVLLPLAIACLAVIIAIPIAAARAHLHIPAYAGLAFLSFLLALLIGWLSGMRTISGTVTGLCLSVSFFLLIACTAGCILALFFYRHPPDA
jgi:hypothetical protein